MANTIVRVAQTAYQVFVQPVINAVAHCISQPSAGSCLQAATTIALALIPELRAEEAPTLLRAGGSEARLSMNMDTVSCVADKYGIDISGNDIQINKTVAGLRGSTAPDQSITLYREHSRTKSSWQRPWFTSSTM